MPSRPQGHDGGDDCPLHCRAWREYTVLRSNKRLQCTQAGKHGPAVPGRVPPREPALTTTRHPVTLGTPGEIRAHMARPTGAQGSSKGSQPQLAPRRCTEQLPTHPNRACVAGEAATGWPGPFRVSWGAGQAAGRHGSWLDWWGPAPHSGVGKPASLPCIAMHSRGGLVRRCLLRRERSFAV